MRRMRRAVSTVVLVLAVLGLTASTAWADPYDADSVANLEAADWKAYEAEAVAFGPLPNTDFTTYCKPVSEATEDDHHSLPLNEPASQQAVKKISGHYAEVFEGTEHEQDNADDYVMYCVSPEGPEGSFFCVGRNQELPDQGSLVGRGAELPMECWDRDNNQSRSLGEDVSEFLDNPVGTAVGSGIGEFATSLNQGFREFIAQILYWWVMVPHTDPTRWGAGSLWPIMTGLSMLLGSLFLIGRGVKLMITGKPEILVTTIKGLAKYVLVCAIGITVLTSALHFSEWLTGYFLDVGTHSDGCAAYQSGQPDGLEIDYAQLETEGAQAEARAELGQAFGNCLAGQFAAGTLSAGLVIVLFVLALIVGLIQALLMFVREAALPIMALLLPIAASGQIGGSATKRWLPGLIALMATVVLYKPMLAFVFAVGFTQIILGTELMSIIMGFITLSIGVIAPGVMLKAFKPMMTMGVEEGASPGSVINNAFLGSQLAGSASQWAEKHSGEQAARSARTQAAQHAAHAGGGLTLSATKNAAQGAASTGAAVAGGPAGLLAKAGQAFKSVISGLGRNGKGPEGQIAARSHPHAGEPHGAGPQSGLHLRQPGQGQPPPSGPNGFGPHPTDPPPPGSNGSGLHPADPGSYGGPGHDPATTPSLREPYDPGPGPGNFRPRLDDLGPGATDHRQEDDQ